MNNKITKELIDAVQWLYGFNKKESIEYIKSCTNEMIESILICYYNEGLKAFYNDWKTGKAGVNPAFSFSSVVKPLYFGSSNFDVSAYSINRYKYNLLRLYY